MADLAGLRQQSSQTGRPRLKNALLQCRNLSDRYGRRLLVHSRSHLRYSPGRHSMAVIAAVSAVCFITLAIPAQASPQLQSIPYQQFLEHFRQGKPIIGKAIPVSYIHQAFAHDNASPKARLDIRKSVITGRLLLPTLKPVAVNEVDNSLRPYFSAQLRRIRVPIS